MEKIILITGVSSGIGNAFVRFCANKLPKSWVVIGLGRHNIDFDTGSLKYLFVKTDLSKKTEIHQAIEAVIKKYGRLDVFINNAGIGYQGTVEELSISDIRKQFEINFFGPVIILKGVIQIMRGQNSGHIINVSSIGAISPNPTLGYYDATKSAMDTLMDCLSQELKDTKIKVSSLILGAVKSNFGKNMVKFQSDTGLYSHLHDEWKKRFKYFFKKRNTTEEAASAIVSLINSRREVAYLRLYDQILCKLKLNLPTKLFSYLNLNVFFKNES